MSEKLENLEKDFKGQNIGKRVFKLITGELLIGDCETVMNKAGAVEILVKNPYTSYNGGLVQYLMPELAGSPAAVQIHPMNIIFNVLLSEFTEAEKAYNEATTPKSNIITDIKKPILI